MIGMDLIIITGISTAVSTAGHLIHNQIIKRDLKRQLQDPTQKLKTKDEEFQAMGMNMRNFSNDLSFVKRQMSELQRGHSTLEQKFRNIKK